ncbi:Protein MAINTENANCE OF MERISTEMS, partial [Mucuna pruriens]
MPIILDNVSPLLNLPIVGTHLNGIYRAHVQVKRVIFTTKSYLLYLVGFMIYVDKIFTCVDVAYLKLFHDLDKCNEHAWGVTALCYLYDQVNTTNIHQMK